MKILEFKRSGIRIIAEFCGIPRNSEQISQPSVKHKARLCAHGRLQQLGTNCWETYSPVVNMVTVCLILLLAQIYKPDLKAIDFVLAFPQAELDVNIWMYLPIGFQVDTVK
jgi:hypothetical protein